MSKVYNWQLGRDMEYPYDAKYPVRQFAFVFNINRCIACQTCTLACKTTWTFSPGQLYMHWNNVETKPYGGHPQNWDLKTLALLEAVNPDGQRWDAAKTGANDAGPYGRFDGMTVFEAAAANKNPAGPQKVLGYLPADDEWKYPNIHEETATGKVLKPNEYGSAALPVHPVWFFYLARLCNHCTYPACLAACPRQAIYKRTEDGIVLIDQERCRGYRKCVEACPYKKSMYNAVTQTSEKCVGCYPRIEGKDPELSPNGEPIETRCMTACVGKIRMQGFIRIGTDGRMIKDPENPLHFLIQERKVALPLYPQFGTEPNGYYIPPRWVPRPYLIQMFGPGVERAIEQYVCPDRELLGVLQLFRAQQHILSRFKIEKGKKIAEREITMPSGKKKMQEIFNDTAIGYNEAGAEVIRIRVEEPTFTRPDIHLNTI